MKHAFAFVVIALLAGLSAGCGAGPDARSSRQDEVARLGSRVMPFDLARTKHFFDDDATGGIETITANGKDDAAQVDLIRSHLATEAERFGRGDFSDPAVIHGHDMPGLATLAAAGGKLRVTYRDVPGGAHLTFASSDPAVVGAVHEWFSAQRSDHGMHGHMHR